jgi:hypothetical protein
MSFYENLRDNTAGPLIKQFGQVGTYRVYSAEAYNNTTGKTTQGTATLVTIRFLDLPLNYLTLHREFSEEAAAEAQAKLLVSAKELAEAGVVPQVDAEILADTKVWRILAINPVGPSGIPVIYKMMVK